MNWSEKIDFILDSDLKCKNIYFNDKKIGEGQGKSKKIAEQEAAHQALINGGEHFGD